MLSRYVAWEKQARSHSPGVQRAAHPGLCKCLCDARTTKWPNDTCLSMYPHWEAVHDCTTTDSSNISGERIQDWSKNTASTQWVTEHGRKHVKRRLLVRMSIIRLWIKNNSKLEILIFFFKSFRSNFITSKISIGTK